MSGVPLASTRGGAEWSLNRPGRFSRNFVLGSWANKTLKKRVVEPTSSVSCWFKTPENGSWANKTPNLFYFRQEDTEHLAESNVDDVGVVFLLPTSRPDVTTKHMYLAWFLFTFYHFLSPCHEHFNHFTVMSCNLKTRFWPPPILYNSFPYLLVIKHGNGRFLHD